MAQDPQHSAMDALLSNVQEAALSVGAAGRSPGQLQGGSRAGDRAEEAVPQGGGVLPGAHAGRAASVCARLQGSSDQ